MTDKPEVEQPKSSAPHDLPTAEEIAAERKRDRATGDEIIRNTGIVTGFLMISRFAGILREMLMARVLGANAASDIYRFVVERVMQDLYTKFEKLLQPTYMPVFVHRRANDGEPQAWEFTSVLGSFQMLFLAAVAALGILFAPQITRFMAGDVLTKHPQLFGLCVLSLRVALPALVIYSLSNLQELTIQSYKEFTLPALAEAARRIAIIVALVAVVVIFHKPTDYQEATALIWGAIIGALARFAVMVPALRRRQVKVHFSLDVKNPDMRRAGVLMIPLVVGVIFALTRNLVETKLAFSFGAGALSALAYARKMTDTPWQLIGVAVSQVVYPYIAELGAVNRRDKMADSLISVARVLSFIFVPAAVAMMVMAAPLTRVAFVYGSHKFTPEAVSLTVAAFLFYAPGLPFFAMEDSQLKWFYALHDTTTPIILGVFADMVYFATVYVGMFRLHLQLPALALGLVLSKALKVLTAFVILHFRLGGFKASRIVPYLGQMAIATGAMCIVMIAATHSLRHLIDVGPLKAVAYLAICGTAGAVTFLVTSYLLRIQEVGMVVERVGARLKRR